MVQGEKVLEVHCGQLYFGKQIYIGKYLLIKRKVTRNFPSFSDSVSIYVCYLIRRILYF